jgi:hypothetical protein
MSGLRLLISIVAACAATTLAAAGPASADVINVTTSGVDGPACGGVGNPCATPAYALNNRVTPQPDTVSLGAGEFTMPGIVVGNPNASGDTIQGAGSQGLPGGTQLKHSNAGGDAQLWLNVPMTVRALQVKVPLGAAAARTAITVSNTAGGSRVEDVSVLVENASTAPFLVGVGSAPNVVIDRLRTLGNHVNDAVNLHVAAGAVVQDSNLRGGTAAIANALSMDGGDVVVRRTKLSRDFAAPGLDPVVEALNSQLRVESSLIAGGRIGINSQATPGSGASLTLRGTTIDVATAGVADAGVDRNPIYVRTTMPGAATSTARVERSVLVEPVYAFAEAGSTVKVDCLDSIVPLAESPIVACGAGNGNLAAAPGDVFANAGAGDWRLKPGSPAVDGASADLAAGESATDLDGNPRILDGDADCLARADRGAYELTGAAADPAACAPPPPPPPPPGPQPQPNYIPVLQVASFSPAAFRTKGKKKGTTLRVRLSEPATLTVTVEALLPGRRKGKKCVAPTRKNRRAKTCTRSVRRGTASFPAKAGANAIAFSGRLGTTTLPPGAYRAILLARDTTNQASKTLTLSFRIVSS